LTYGSRSCCMTAYVVAWEFLKTLGGSRPLRSRAWRAWVLYGNRGLVAAVAARSRESSSCTRFTALHPDHHGLVFGTIIAVSSSSRWRRRWRKKARPAKSPPTWRVAAPISRRSRDGADPIGSIPRGRSGSSPSSRRLPPPRSLPGLDSGAGAPYTRALSGTHRDASAGESRAEHPHHRWRLHGASDRARSRGPRGGVALRLAENAMSGDKSKGASAQGTMSGAAAVRGRLQSGAAPPISRCRETARQAGRRRGAASAKPALRHRPTGAAKPAARDNPRPRSRRPRPRRMRRARSQRRREAPRGKPAPAVKPLPDVKPSAGRQAPRQRPPAGSDGRGGRRRGRSGTPTPKE